MPDRPFFMRHRTTSVAEINGYTNVLRAGASKRGAFVYVARGHAYLATRRPRLALFDYDVGAEAPARGSAPARGKRRSPCRLWAATAEALAVLDRAVAQRPQDPDALGSRAFVLLPLIASPTPTPTGCGSSRCCRGSVHDARACVALRIANYQRALDELEPARERSPATPTCSYIF